MCLLVSGFTATGIDDLWFLAAASYLSISKTATFVHDNRANIRGLFILKVVFAGGFVRSNKDILIT